MRHEFPEIRFDNVTPLDEDQLRSVAPSVFANSAHSSRSERFMPIPTIDVLHALNAEGFYVIGAKQMRAKTPDRVNYCKHLLRLRRTGDKLTVGDTTFEMLLKNANDGTASYDLMGGLFRILCLNGMVCGMGTADSLRVTHTGNVIEKVIEGTYRVLEMAQLVLEAPKSWSGIELKEPERMAFAKAAYDIRFPEENAIEAVQLLHPRRPEDGKRDLWTTFNVIQENAMKGGLSATDTSGERPRRRTTRAINGIDQDVRINRQLWRLADAVGVKHGLPTLIREREDA